MTYQVSFFTSGINKRVSNQVSITDMFDGIRSGRWINEIQRFRSIADDSERGKAKIKLPAFTPHGTFEGERTYDTFIDHSGIYCLDLDHNNSIRDALKDDPYVYALHSSVSGNGLAIYVKAHNLTQFKVGYGQVVDYFQKKFNVQIDAVCFDLPRLRIVTHDPELYLNPDSLVFGQLPSLSRTQATEILFGDELEHAITKLEALGVDILEDSYEVCMKVAYALLSEVPATTAESYMRRIWNLSSKYRAYADDELARRFREWRKHDETKGGSCTIATFWYLANQKAGIKPPHRRQRVEQSIRAVKRSGQSADLAFKEVEQVAQVVGDDHGAHALKVLINSVYLEPEITIGSFWFVDDKERLVIDEKRLLCDWLPTQGVMYLKHTEGYELVRVVDKIIEPIEIIELKQMVMLYVSTLPWEFDGVERFLLESAIIKNAKSIFSIDKLHFLPTLAANMLRDGRHESRFFYTNGWLSINAYGWQLKPYHELPGYIWRNQVKSRAFVSLSPENYLSSEFATVLFNMSGKNQDRYNALCSAVGYALHTYKDPSKPYAVILQDQEMGDEPQGGTGKDLVMKAIGHLRNVVYQSGKSFDPMKNFAFQRVDRRTELVVLQDLRKGVSFESLFNIISDGIEVERKHKDQYLLSYEESPKIGITTNYPLKENGSSNKRRKGKGEIEIAPHYSPTFSPFDEFGHNLFNDWQEAEWHKFDNFMANCVAGYLAHGMAESPDINRSKNALRTYTEDGFAEWMDDWWEHANKDARGWAAFRSSQLHNLYMSEVSPDITLERFSKWVKTWAAARSRKFEKANMTFSGIKAQWTFISPIQ